MSLPFLAIFLSVVAMLKTTTIPLHYRLMHAMVQPALETE
jgi:hypothetical protein